ncbi:MAG: sll0787 family AIR synthase-like protein [Cyanobacteria bacterium J06598_1]
MLDELIATLRSALSILHKQDIQTAANALGQSVLGPAVQGTGAEGADEQIRLGDDCAAIADGEGYLLLAAEGIWPQLVAQDPWFAGWCAVMVNVSDIAAMGGVPTAIVDALWSPSVEASEPLWAGMTAAAQAYGVPIVGGHTNCHSPYAGLAVSILGRAQRLITSFDAQSGDSLVMVVNMAGAYYGDYPFWNAATEADVGVLRSHIGLLPQLAELGLVNVGKDISMGGLAGTLLMLAEASGCGAVLDLDRVPRPVGVAWDKWLTSFPSFGFLLSVPQAQVSAVKSVFQSEGLVCEAVGEVISERCVYLQLDGEKQLLWDLSEALTGFSQSL